MTHNDFGARINTCKVNPFKKIKKGEEKLGMKKYVVFIGVIIVAMFFVGTGFAGNQNNTGCGLGSIIFEDHDGLVSQVCAVTTNGTFGNQTFAITSGTSNAEKPADFWASKKLHTYVAENMDNLATDIAKGDGEYLNTLAVLMEVPEDQRAGFYANLQSNFSRIYTSQDVNHEDIIRNIKTVVLSS